MRLDGTLVWVREMTIEDAEELHDLRIRNRTFFEPYEPLATEQDWTQEAVRAGLARGLEERERGESYTFGVYPAGRENLVGRFRLSNIFRGPWQNGNLGYYVDEASNGRGYATEAVTLVTTIAFRELQLHRVQAGVMTDNVRSMRVLEKAGFRREGIALRYLNIYGEWRDHEIFAVTAEEWER